MTSAIVGWLVVLLSGAIAPETSPPSSAPITLTGKAVELTDALRPIGIEFDAEPVARQVVVKGPDGTLTPLLSDGASRALFVDKRLRDRPVEIQGRRYAGLPYVQVVSFKVEENGRFQTPEYYCEICTISVRYPQTCPCCQGPMDLRMKPEGR